MSPANSQKAVRMERAFSDVGVTEVCTARANAAHATHLTHGTMQVCA